MLGGGGVEAGSPALASWAGLKTGRGLQKVRGPSGAESVQKTHRPSESAELGRRPALLAGLDGNRFPRTSDTPAPPGGGGDPGASVTTVPPAGAAEQQRCRQAGEAWRESESGRGRGAGRGPRFGSQRRIPVARNQGGRRVRSHT